MGALRVVTGCGLALLLAGCGRSGDAELDSSAAGNGGAPDAQATSPSGAGGMATDADGAVLVPDAAGADAAASITRCGRSAPADPWTMEGATSEPRFNAAPAATAEPVLPSGPPVCSVAGGERTVIAASMRDYDLVLVRNDGTTEVAHTFSTAASHTVGCCIVEQSVIDGVLVAQAAWYPSEGSGLEAVAFDRDGALLWSFAEEVPSSELWVTATGVQRINEWLAIEVDAVAPDGTMQTFHGAVPSSSSTFDGWVPVRVGWYDLTDVYGFLRPDTLEVRLLSLPLARQSEPFREEDRYVYLGRLDAERLAVSAETPNEVLMAPLPPFSGEPGLHVGECWALVTVDGMPRWRFDLQSGELFALDVPEGIATGFPVQSAGNWFTASSPVYPENAAPGRPVWRVDAESGRVFADAVDPAPLEFFDASYCTAEPTLLADGRLVLSLHDGQLGGLFLWDAEAVMWKALGAPVTDVMEVVARANRRYGLRAQFDRGVHVLSATDRALECALWGADAAFWGVRADPDAGGGAARFSERPEQLVIPFRRRVCRARLRE